MGMLPQRYVPLGFEQLDATALASAVTLTVPAGATHAIIGALAGTVAWRDDGTAPTADTGIPLAANATLEYSGDLAAIQFIKISGSPTLNVSYYRCVG